MMQEKTLYCIYKVTLNKIFDIKKILRKTNINTFAYNIPNKKNLCSKSCIIAMLLHNFYLVKPKGLLLCQNDFLNCSQFSPTLIWLISNILRKYLLS